MMTLLTMRVCSSAFGLWAFLGRTGEHLAALLRQTKLTIAVLNLTSDALLRRCQDVTLISLTDAVL